MDQPSGPDRLRVLLVSFSLSNQTRKLARAMKDGLRQGAQVRHLRLVPEPPMEFPFGSIAKTIYMMVATLFRMRIPIEEVDIEGLEAFAPDLVILAGPTWSYNPSGPMLTFLDRHAKRLLGGRPVLPVISCRGYWRFHWFYLRRRILSAGGEPLGPWVFTHPAREPWRTIGVFLTVAGRHPKRLGFMKRHYRRYGHSRRQIEAARELGRRLADSGRGFRSWVTQQVF